MGAHVYIAHSIRSSDSHLVYAIGDVVGRQGLPVEYWYEHQGQQYAYDMVSGAQLFVGLIASSAQLKTVYQLYEYAQRMQVPTMLLAERGVNLPSKVARNPNVLIFQRSMPQNPIQFVEMYFSRRP